MAVFIFSAYLAVCLFVISVFFAGTLMFGTGRKRSSSEFSTARVSILKPVKNADGHFESNLITFYEQDYKNFEILFGVETMNEPEISIINRVSAKFPEVRTVIVYTGTDKELNPKVDNLVKMERFATGTHFWIADANVRVRSDTLKNLMNECFENGSRLVFSPILGTGSVSAGSLAENMHLSFSVSGSIISAWALAQRQITVGKSMLLEKKALEENFGGFSYFLKYLAEDYMMGRKYEKRGIRVSTNFTWVENVNSGSTFKSFFERISRWAVMRYNIDRKWYLAEILFLNPVIVAVPAVFSGNRVLAISGLSVIIFKITAEFICMAFNDGKDFLKLRNIVRFIPVFFLKEVIVAGSLMVPFLTRKVNWRGRKIKVGKNSIINYQDDIFPVQEEI